MTSSYVQLNHGPLICTLYVTSLFKFVYYIIELSREILCSLHCTRFKNS